MITDTQIFLSSSKLLMIVNTNIQKRLPEKYNALYFMQSRTI